MARSSKNFLPQQEELIELALDLFMEKGYENTTITDIMRASGLSKGGLYHYFSSKEEILDAVIEYSLNLESQKYRIRLDTLPIEQQLPYLLQINQDMNQLAKKLLHYKTYNQTSYASYRIREMNIHYVIPMVEEIFERGIQAGLYQTQNPKEIAEFATLQLNAIIDSQLLPEATLTQRLERLNVFLQLFQGCVTPQHQDHWQEIGRLLTEQLKQFYQENSIEIRI